MAKSYKKLRISSKRVIDIRERDYFITDRICDLVDSVKQSGKTSMGKMLQDLTWYILKLYSNLEVKKECFKSRLDIFVRNKNNNKKYALPCKSTLRERYKSIIPEIKMTEQYAVFENIFIITFGERRGKVEALNEIVNKLPDESWKITSLLKDYSNPNIINFNEMVEIING